MRTNAASRDMRTAFTALCALITFGIGLGVSQAPHAQTFPATGSDGSDGALNPAPGSTVVLALDADADNVFQFTSINIGADVTVRLTGSALQGPVFWLASGSVQIDGTIDLSGEPGQDSTGILNDALRLPAIPGAGGFSGGIGGTSTSGRTEGKGPGGGRIANSGGGGAGHAGGGGGSRGCGAFNTSRCSNGGAAYGSDFLVPLIGGSGGAGGTGAGGGAGGGAILIASDVSITLDGSIVTDGGNGGASGGRHGGAGSGGAIRLVAPTISGTGNISAAGGESFGGSTTDGGNGSGGRVRLEAFSHEFAGTSNPAPKLATPFELFLPATPPPLVSVISVDGINVSNPSASITAADVEIDSIAPVEVRIQTENLPVESGDPLAPTTVVLQLVSENAPDQFVTFSLLAGDATLATWNADVTFPSGFSRGYASAEWEP